MMRELRWRLGIAPLQLGVLQSRAHGALTRARATLREIVHRARGGWPVVTQPAPWYAEKLTHHDFAIDPRRDDAPVRCPRCGCTGRIEHGEHRRCRCGLAMAVSGNALLVWSAGTPHHAATLDAETGTTTVVEVERGRNPSRHTHPPDEARTHADGAVHRRREVSAVHAPGHRATVHSVHCPSCTKRIVNSPMDPFSRWLCACGDIIHVDVMASRTWRDRPVDQYGRTEPTAEDESR